MHTRDAVTQIQDRQHALLAGLAALVPAMQHRAIALDPAGTFPAEDIEALRAIGALAAPIPTALGGLGFGIEPEAALPLMEALRLLGRGNLSLGRLFEAHVNALRLIHRYGTQTQARHAAEDAHAGHLFGLWVTDPPNAKLAIAPDGTLQGGKSPCSGAGHATRALVTTSDTMRVIALTPGTRADLSQWDTHGMRASASGAMDLTGLPAGPPIGAPGDYLRQPDFSAGAWRGSAVTLGGMEALTAALRATLSDRHRDTDPHQRARIGRALIAQETARLWVRRAALLAEATTGDPDDTANTVNLARLAVESACLDLIQITQRALGMAAFRRGSLTELLFRDLPMYLRQPAPDETLTEAAAHFTRRDLPALT
jgi:alkylation response protein AidB-like acyl-CoA dehydrogenase